MSAPRGLVVALAVLAALVLQTSALPVLVGGGSVVPDLCLLVVVAAGLGTGELPGAVTGFAAGLALDLAPPADHLAGRWALGLMLAGWLAGRLAPLRTPARATLPDLPAARRWADRSAALARVLVVTAVAALVSTSAFALSGLLFGELSWGVPELLRGLGEAVLADTVAAALVVPSVLGLLGLLGPAHPAAAELAERAAAR